MGAELSRRAQLPGWPYLFDLCLQVPQLHALLQVLAVLLGRHVQLLLLLVQELQQVLHASGHVHVSVAQQLHTCSRGGRTGMTRKASETNCSEFPSSSSKFNLILGGFAYMSVGVCTPKKCNMGVFLKSDTYPMQSYTVKNIK